MTPDQIVAAIGLLLAEPDPAFETLRAGGFDDRYPVTVSACPETTAPLDIEGQTILCGTVSVPEDYAAPEGRRVALEFAVGRARSTNPFDDAIVYLHGGPAAGALDSIASATEVILGDHRQYRDVVTFDQRAAMLSSSTVRCSETIAENMVDLVLESAGMPPAEEEGAEAEMIFAPCTRELYDSGADVSDYNTTNNARDVRALMSALGYPEYNILGISYGTRLALEVLRTAPEGVRAVIVDGVAPTNKLLYDDFFGPHGDAMDALFEQCAAQPACAQAYPDLRKTFIDLGDILTSNPIPASRGMPEVTADTFYGLVKTRTHFSQHWVRDLTAYLPRMITELAAGDATTFDWYLTTYADGANLPGTASELLGPGATRLSGDERALALAVLENAQAMTDQSEGVAAAMAQLKHDVVAAPAALSVAEAFDQRATDALGQLTQQALVPAVQDYARLHVGDRTRAAIAQWVMAHFQGPDQAALLSLVAAMTDDDVARTFDIAATDLAPYEGAVEGNMGLFIYACQEDLPYNSRAGLEQRVADFPYGVIATPAQVQGIVSLYDVCDLFEPAPRDGFHDPVVSDVPVLSLGGTNDTQTSWRWSGEAAKTLSNAQVIIFPNSGHGASLYSRCGLDISAKFILDPEAKLDQSCVDDLVPQFVLPDAPLP
ncbi:alpha/beta hydrolase [Thalassococcus sp. BH17M4-6]|uniref:alpha/beta hydrolase n=1 Tax=Thalassococcus sp. BH17M4-6 TaxID=3413148 RepID=UPI003BD15859